MYRIEIYEYERMFAALLSLSEFVPWLLIHFMHTLTSRGCEIGQENSILLPINYKLGQEIKFKLNEEIEDGSMKF